MRRAGLVTIAIAGVVCTGCMTAPVIPAIGYLYTDTKAPLDYDVNDTTLGSKIGSASTTSILGLFATGDASIASAARAGNIKTIRHADYEYQNVLGIYQKFTTVVRGD